MARESQIQIHRTEATGATPSGLTSGELAVNLKDQKLFVGLSSGGYLTFNSDASSSYSIVSGGNGIVVGTTVAGTANTYIVSLNPDITGHTLNITGNAIFSGYDSGVTFNGRVSIGNGNPETSGGWGLYKNPDAYNTTPSSGVAGLVDFTKTIASSIDYANRVGGKVAELVPANAYFPGVINVKTVLDIDSITGAGMFLAKAYSTTGQGNLIGQYLGNLGGVPPLYYKNAPGDTPQTAVNSGLERALLVENINVNFQALGLNTSQIGTPFRTLIQYGTWIDNVQAEDGNLGGAPAASGTYETTFDKYVRTGYLLRGGAGTSGGATGTYVWSRWKNLVETTDDLGKYGVSTVNGGTGDISITGAGSNAAVVVRSSVAGINRIDARLATTSLTGVASFSSVSFNVGGTGEVTLKNPSTSFGVQGNSGGKADVTLGGNLTLTGSGSIRTEATQDFNGDGVDVVFDNRIATTSLTGVASFHPSHFTVTNGNVVASFSGGVTFTGTPVFSSGLSATGITANSVFTNKLTATNASFSGGVTFSGGLSASGLATFSNGLTALGGIHTRGLTATTAVFNGLATFNSGLTTTGLATFSNGLTSLGGIHTTGLTATTAVFNGLATFNNGLTTTGLATFSNGLTSLGGIHTRGLTATTAVFNGLATFNTGLTTTGLATFSNGLTSLGGIHTTGLTATTAVFNGLATFNTGLTTTGLATFNTGLTTTGLATFSNGLTAPGGIHTVGLTATNGRFTGNLTVDGNTTNTGTQTFNGGIQTTGLTSTGGLSASGLVYFTNGLTAPGGIHTVGLTATTAVFNGLARFNNGLTTTGLATFSSGLTARGGIFTNGLTANTIFISNFGVSTNGFYFGTEAQGVAISPNDAIAAQGILISGDIQQVAALAPNPGTTFAGIVFAPTIKASNIVNQIAVGNATLTGNVSLTSGSNVTMTVVGNQVTIESSSSVGGGGGATTSALNTWTKTQTFDGGIQTTGLTSTGGLSASGLVYFTNGLTAPGGIHTRGLTAFNIVGTNASFASGVTFTGTPVFSSGLSATGITANSVFTNRFSATNASFASGVTFSGTVSGVVKSFNGNDGVVTITGAGQGLGQAIKVTSTVAGTHLIDARLASTSLTGVAYFDINEFNVDADGYVHIKNPNNGSCTDCSIYGYEGGRQACKACGCNFTSQCSPNGVCAYFCTQALSIVDGSGFGVTGVSGTSGSVSLYFDPASLTAYTSNYSNKKTNFVLIFDGDETGLVKAKRATLENFFSENAGLVTSATTGQLSNAVKKVPGGLGTSTIELGVVLGNIAAGQEGLVKGASAYAYIETNTVRSFNGLTGSVTAVGSINGCTAAVVITGSASEIEVLNTCPNIVIGLPDNVTISNLNVLSGATFGGNISAKNVVTSVNGATGAITNVAKTDVNNEFTSAQTFNSYVNVLDNTITVYDSSNEHSIILNASTDTIRFYDDGSGNILDLYAGGNFGNQVIAFPSSNTTLAGLAVSQTFTDTNTFNNLTNFASGISAAGDVTFSGTLKGVTASFTGLLSASQGISASGATFSGNISARNIVTSFNGLTGAVAGVTTSVANIFTALNSFNAGISASGATFANDIKVNGVNIGLGGGNIASNLGIGKGALTGNSGGLFNTAVGSGAMEIGTNSYSIAFGFNALNSCTGGGINNVALGSSTLTTISSASNNVAIGSNSSQTLVDGSNNISIGGESLLSNANGSSNLAIGYQALSSNFTSNNIGIGYQALYTNDEGQQNTAIGNEALKSIATTGSAERNTAIGYQAGRWRGTGTSVISNRLNTANDSIFIGWRARSSADAQTNQIVIGSNTLGGGSNTTTIGTTASTDATIYGKLHGTNGVSGPTASFNSLTVSQNTTLGSTASNTTTIYGAKIVNEGVYANGSLRTANISFANGQVQTLTGVGTGATGMTAIYFTSAPSTGAASVTAIITNGGLMTGAGMTSWGGNIKWPGGTKPVLTSSGVDVVSFVTPDAGTTIYGFVGGLGFS